jgi:hypothetical protein
MDKKFNLNRQLFQMRRSIRENASATAEEYRCYNQMSLDNKIEEAKLEKEYYQKFQKVVSEEKIYRYYHANAQFMRNTVKH